MRTKLCYTVSTFLAVSLALLLLSACGRVPVSQQNQVTIVPASILSNGENLTMSLNIEADFSSTSGDASHGKIIETYSFTNRSAGNQSPLIAYPMLCNCSSDQYSLCYSDKYSVSFESYPETSSVRCQAVYSWDETEESIQEIIKAAMEKSPSLSEEVSGCLLYCDVGYSWLIKEAILRITYDRSECGLFIVGGNIVDDSSSDYVDIQISDNTYGRDGRFLYLITDNDIPQENFQWLYEGEDISNQVYATCRFEPFTMPVDDILEHTEIPDELMKGVKEIVGQKMNFSSREEFYISTDSLITDYVKENVVGLVYFVTLTVPVDDENSFSVSYQLPNETKYHNGRLYLPSLQGLDVGIDGYTFSVKEGDVVLKYDANFDIAIENGCGSAELDPNRDDYYFSFGRKN